MMENNHDDPKESKDHISQDSYQENSKLNTKHKNDLSTRIRTSTLNINNVVTYIQCQFFIDKVTLNKLRVSGLNSIDEIRKDFVCFFETLNHKEEVLS